MRGAGNKAVLTHQWESLGCSTVRICASSRSSRAASAPDSPSPLSALNALSACCLLKDLLARPQLSLDVTTSGHSCPGSTDESRKTAAAKYGEATCQF